MIRAMMRFDGTFTSQCVLTHSIPKHSRTKTGYIDHEEEKVVLTMVVLQAATRGGGACIGSSSSSR